MLPREAILVKIVFATSKKRKQLAMTNRKMHKQYEGHAYWVVEQPTAHRVFSVSMV
jgi:hypothetical protein